MAMTIEELKKALVEVHNICKSHEEDCADCPFGADTSNAHICYLSPSLYDDTIPEKWAVSGWAFEGMEDSHGNQT